MASRALGAFFALAAATAFGVSIASQAWWAGHPIVNGKEWVAKDVQVGLLGATGCNTAGDGSCERLPVDETIEYVSYGELGAIGLATFFAFLVMLAAWKVSDRRRGIAATSIVTTLLAAGGAGGLLYIGPGIEAQQNIAVPIGWGAFALGGGVLASMIASLITRRLEPEPLRLKPSHAQIPTTVPKLQTNVQAQMDIGLLPTLPPPEPAMSAPPLTRDSIKDMMSGPAVNPAQQPIETLMAPSPPVPAPLHLASDAGLGAPIARNKPPSAGPLLPSTPALPSSAPSAPLLPSAPSLSSAPLIPSTPLRGKPPSGAPVASTSPPAVPTTPSRGKPPSLPGMTLPGTARAPVMPARPKPPSVPERTKEPSAPPPRPKSSSLPPATSKANSGVPSPIAAAPSKPNARVPLPAKGQAPKRDSAPRMSTEPGGTAAPDPTNPRSSRPAIALKVPLPEQRARTEVDDEIVNDTAVEIDHDAKAAAKAERALTDIRTGKNALGKANDTAVEIDHEAKAAAQRAAEMRNEEGANETTDIGVEIPIAPTTEPIPAQVGPDPTSQTLLAPDPRSSQPVMRAPIPSLDAPRRGQLPMSTASTALPPPKKLDAVPSGPTPACPQCESPMAWVEEHLRFYCRECRMYF